jgi:hypothetical protein
VLLAPEAGAAIAAAAGLYMDDDFVYKHCWHLTVDKEKEKEKEKDPEAPQSGRGSGLSRDLSLSIAAPPKR